MQKIATLCVLVSLLAGCASHGNQCLRHENATTMGTKIVEGVTTKAEVQKILGAPKSVAFSGEKHYETWQYEFQSLSADATAFIPIVSLFGSTYSGKEKTLAILFDDCGIVKRYVLLEADTKVKTGIFNS